MLTSSCGIIALVEVVNSVAIYLSTTSLLEMSSNVLDIVVACWALGIWGRTIVRNTGLPIFGEPIAILVQVIPILYSIILNRRGFLTSIVPRQKG